MSIYQTTARKKSRVFRSIQKIGAIVFAILIANCISAQEDSGFISKSNKKTTSNKYSNTWAEAKKDSIDHDSTVHVFGSYNFRDDKDIPFRAKRQIKKGDLFFELGPGKYDRAMKHYKKAYKIDPNVAYVDFKIGQCYLLMRQQKFKSILYLEKAYHQNRRVSKEIHYYLGRSHQVNNDYVRAIEEYEKSKSEYRKAHRKDHISVAEKHEHMELINKHINECKFAMLLKEDPKKVLIETVGDSINTTYSDYDPFVTADESMMIFTSRRKGTRGGGRADIDHVYYEDLYVSYNKGGFWTKAKPMKNKFNKHTNDAVIGMSHDGKELFVYRDTKQGDIYLAPLDGDAYGRPKPIKEINTGYHESSACFSFDKKTIYFVSDKPGGYGGRDIYKSELQEDGSWGEPENMGRPLNTKYDEERIFLHPNGKILFFCSKGHNSMGGYDIFFSELDEKGKWGEPQNMGYPINSPDDDISFVTTATGETGYFSSYRPNGTGDRDIYQIRFGISSKIGTLNREDDLLSKRKVMDKEEFVAELMKMGIDPIEVEDVGPILPDLTMENLEEMIEQWDNEINELLALVDSVNDKKERVVLEEQIKVKKNELNILKEAANPNEIATLNDQVQLRQNEIDSLQARLDSTDKKKEIKLLEEQILVKKEELALLNSVYVRGKDSTATDELPLAQLTGEAKVIQEEILALEEQAKQAKDEDELRAIEEQISVKQDELNTVLSGEEVAENIGESELNGGTSVSDNESTTTEVSTSETDDSIQLAENESEGTSSISDEEFMGQLSAKENEVAQLQEQLKTASSDSEKQQIEAQLKAAENELAELMELAESSNVSKDTISASENESADLASLSEEELNGQIELKENQIAELQAQMKTATNEQERAELEQKIKLAENELADMMALADNSDTSDQSTIEIANNQTVGTNETETTQDTSPSPTLEMSESSGAEAMSISNDELYLVEYKGKYTAYSEDDLDDMTGQTSSQITQENMAINDLKKKIAMTEDKKERVTYEAELELREKKVQELKQEMDALLDAETVASNLENSEVSEEQKNAIEKAVEQAKIEMAQNQSAAPAESEATEQSGTTPLETSSNESAGEMEATETAKGTETTGSIEPAGNESSTSMEGNTTEESGTQTIGSGDMTEGESIILENVLFDFDKSTLRPESYETLDKLVEIMEEPPATSKVELSGHTDSKGPAEYNQRLSERRAQAVVDYLIKKGISKDRLVPKGYGESRPAAPNNNPDGTDNPEGRQLNRRTELKLLKQ